MEFEHTDNEIIIKSGNPKLRINHTDDFGICVSCSLGTTTPFKVTALSKGGKKCQFDATHLFISEAK